MLRSHNRLFHYGIVGCDLTLIAVALYLSSGYILDPAWMPHSPQAPSALTLTLQGLLTAAAWVFMAMRSGVYRSWRTGSRWREAGALLEAMLLAISLGGVLSLAFWGFLAYQPLIGLAFAFGFITSLRLSVRGTLAHVRSHGRNFRRMLVVGRSSVVDSILQRIEQSPHFGIRVVGGVSLPGEESRLLPRGLQDLGTTEQLCEAIADSLVNRVVICPSSNARAQDVQRTMDLCDEAGIPCAYMPNFVAARNVQTTASWLGDMPMFMFSSIPGPSFQVAVKRLMDIAGALVAVFLTLPVQIACALMIKLQDGGPIFFKQERVGAGGRRFGCLKFRTMRMDADKLKKDLMALNEQDGPVFKIKKDPRITPMGRILRKYSLDELPQLYNVLFGDMSLVGPRPPVPDEVSRYEWWQRKRISIRPGITCIWQVWGRNKVSFKRWVEMDLYYIDNWSLWLDVKLLLHTVRTVVQGTGS